KLNSGIAIDLMLVVRIWLKYATWHADFLQKHKLKIKDKTLFAHFIQLYVFGYYGVAQIKCRAAFNDVLAQNLLCSSVSINSLFIWYSPIAHCPVPSAFTPIRRWHNMHHSYTINLEKDRPGALMHWSQVGIAAC
ncbi:hypothetical protein ACJX0J_036558, partial [Zea mays]